MSDRSIGATWMFLLLLISLFVLSLTAPRPWDAPAGELTAARLPARREQPLGASAFLPTESASRPIVDRANPLRLGNSRSPMPESSDDEFEVVNLPMHGPEPSADPPANEADLCLELDPLPELDRTLIDETTFGQVPSDMAVAASESIPTNSPALVVDDPPVTAVEVSLRPLREPSLPSAKEAPAASAESASTSTENATENPVPEPAPPAIVPMAEPPVESADNELELGQNLAQAAEEATHTQEGWPRANTLHHQLAELRPTEYGGEWSARVESMLTRFEQLGGARAEGAPAILAKLRQAVSEGEKIALKLEDDVQSEGMRRAGYALQRRLVLWEGIGALAPHDESLAGEAEGRPDRLLAHLENVDELTRSAPQGEGWREYLQLDGLRELAENRQAARERRRRIARQVLDRLSAGELSMKQRRFAAADQLNALRGELRRWAADPVDVEQMLREVEYFEETRSASSGEIITGYYEQLAAAPSPAAQRLARDLDAHYRGANLRVTVTDAFLTKMVPEREPREEFVREEVMGIPTAGYTTTLTDLTVHLVPDPNHLRFVLEASGMVYARTSAQSTGATVFAGMNSSYQILKPFELTLDGMKGDGVSADAQTRTHLRGVDTPLSGIPLVGTMVDGIVRQQYQQRRTEAEQELRRKIIRKAVTQMESEVEERLAKTNEEMRNRVVIPLERLQLRPAVAEMQTTEDRLTLRLRLAADHQLGAMTPRPRAPSDSLASFQVHESVLNNLFNQLDLNGREFSQADLFRWVAERLNLPADKVPDNLRDDVFLTFAPRDSFRVRANEGRVQIDLKLAELAAEGNTFRDFTVRVFYRPDAEAGTGDLVRDGVVQLIGRRINMRGQIALRGIFSKTFPREKRFSLLPARFREDPNLADVRVTQMVVTDGWIGMALGLSPVAPDVVRNPAATTR